MLIRDKARAGARLVDWTRFALGETDHTALSAVSARTSRPALPGRSFDPQPTAFEGSVSLGPVPSSGHPVMPVN